MRIDGMAARNEGTIEGTIDGATCPAGACEVVICGQRVWLMAQRCAYWCAGATLILGDLHLGKLESIAACGAPMPIGLLEAELARLVHACELVRPRRVLVIGDFLHARVGATDMVCDAFAIARAKMGASVEVVPGNHDRALHAVAQRCGVRVLGNVVEEGAFVFTHDATGITGGMVGAKVGAKVAGMEMAQRERVVWSGHVHPAVVLRRRGDRMKLPAFVVGEREVLMPAFSSFTSGVAVETKGKRVFAVGERVVALG